MSRNAVRYSLAGLARQLHCDPRALTALANAAPEHYRPFTIERPGKKPRQIDNPDDALKLVQRLIRKTLLKPLPLPDHVHGCVKKRSQFSNAAVHAGQSNVSSVDVRNFYPSLTNAMIFGLWRDLGYGPRLASMLTRLTTTGRAARKVDQSPLEK